MGESKKKVLRVQFNPSVKLEFHGAKITSDGGLLLFREMDEVMGLTVLAEKVLQDPRTGQNTQHTMTALLRRSPSPKSMNIWKARGFFTPSACQSTTCYNGRSST